MEHAKRAMKAFRNNNKLRVKWNHTSLAPTYEKKKAWLV